MNELERLRLLCLSFVVKEFEAVLQSTPQLQLALLEEFYEGAQYLRNLQNVIRALQSHIGAPAQTIQHGSHRFLHGYRYVIPGAWVLPL